jgi:hypothetical protein
VHGYGYRHADIALEHVREARRKTVALPSSSQVTRLAAGMAMLTMGQALIAQGPAFVMAQRPVDWAHWLLLLGALTLTWRVTEIPLGRTGRFGRLLTMGGAAAFVGMSAIDFILWALPSEAARQALGRQALQAPAISLPFLTVGPALLFVGLATVALDWAGLMRWRVALVVIGVGVVGLGQFGGGRGLVLAGHLIVLMGFVAIWSRVRSVEATRDAARETAHGGT